MNYATNQTKMPSKSCDEEQTEIDQMKRSRVQSHHQHCRAMPQASFALSACGLRVLEKNEAHAIEKTKCRASRSRLSTPDLYTDHDLILDCVLTGSASGQNPNQSVQYTQRTFLHFCEVNSQSSSGNCHVMLAHKTSAICSHCPVLDTSFIF